MKNVTKWFLLTLVLLGSVALGWSWMNTIENDPEIANKPEWSVLQVMDIQDKSKMISHGDILVAKKVGKHGDYDVVGIKKMSLENPIWILTNAKFSPKIKIIPQDFKNIRISRSEYESIISNLSVNEEAEVFLRNAVQ